MKPQYWAALGLLVVGLLTIDGVIYLDSDIKTALGAFAYECVVGAVAAIGILQL